MKICVTSSGSTLEPHMSEGKSVSPAAATSRRNRRADRLMETPIKGSRSCLYIL